MRCFRPPVVREEADDSDAAKSDSVGRHSPSGVRKIITIFSNSGRFFKPTSSPSPTQASTESPQLQIKARAASTPQPLQDAFMPYAALPGHALPRISTTMPNPQESAAPSLELPFHSPEPLAQRSLSSPLLSAQSSLGNHPLQRMSMLSTGSFASAVSFFESFPVSTDGASPTRITRHSRSLTQHPTNSPTQASSSGYFPDQHERLRRCTSVGSPLSLRRTSTRDSYPDIWVSGRSKGGIDVAQLSLELPPPSPDLKAMPSLDPGADWDDFLELMGDDARWLEAESHVRRLEEAYGQERGALVDEQARSVTRDAVHSALARLQTTLSRLKLLDSALEDTEGYTKSSAEPLQVFYRKPSDSEVHNFRFIADFELPAVHILALAREFDLTSSWNWTMITSLLVCERSDMDIDLFAVMRLPWPYKNRRASIRAEGGDCLLHDGAAVILFESADIGEEHMTPASQAAAEVLILPGSGVKLCPIWTVIEGVRCEGCRIVVQMSVNPFMRVLPPVVMNFLLKVVSPLVYRLAKYVIATSVRKPGTALYERVQQRRLFYDKVHSRMLDYLRNQL